MKRFFLYLHTLFLLWTFNIYGCSLEFSWPYGFGFLETSKEHEVYWLKKKSQKFFQTQYEWINFNPKSGKILKSQEITLPFSEKDSIYVQKIEKQNPIFFIFPKNSLCPEGESKFFENEKISSDKIQLIPNDEGGFFVLKKDISAPFSIEEPVLKIWTKEKKIATLKKDGNNFSVYKKSFDKKSSNLIGMFNSDETFLIQNKRSFVISKDYKKNQYKILSSDKTEHHIPFFSFWQPHHVQIHPLDDELYLLSSYRGTPYLVLWDGKSNKLVQMITSKHPYEISFVYWDEIKKVLFIEEKAQQKNRKLSLFYPKNKKWITIKDNPKKKRRKI